MEELKTLNDIWNTPIEGSVDGNTVLVLYNFRLSLRAEAIKWIKELSKYKPCPMCGIRYTGKGLSNKVYSHELYFHCEPCKTVWTDSGKQAVIEWIKHFFNIKDEDL